MVGGLKTFGSPLNLLKKKKKVDGTMPPVIPEVTDTTPKPEPPVRDPRLLREAGNAFIRAREKAESRGASREQANAIAIEESKGIATDAFVPGALEQRQALAGQVGQTTQPTPQGQPTDFGVAVQAGLGRGVIAGTSGAGLGAIGGAVGGAGVGAVPGAAIGGATGFIGGFISGFTSKLKQDANENIQAEYSTLPINTRNMRQLIIDAKTDPMGASDAFNNQLAAIDQAYVDVFMESQESLAKFNSVDAQVELQKFANFYAPGGLRDIYVGRMRSVLLNPNTDVNDLVMQEQSAFESEQQNI